MGRLLILAACLGGCGVSPELYDRDGDGFGAIEGDCGVTCRDCDDSDPTVHPEAVEVCNAVDDDCDGRVDADAADASRWFIDGDQDGFGGSVVLACEQPEGALTDGSDCNDTDGDVFPGADEVCNEVDDDCNGTVDDDAVDASEWFEDADGDGYGAMGASANVGCDPTAGSPSADDCDDTDPLVGPVECRRQIAVADEHSCSALGGNVQCWGSDQFALLAAPSSHITMLDVARGYACGVVDDGSIECWGDLMPNGVPTSTPFSGLATSESWAVAIDTAGTAVFWGTDNGHGASEAPSVGLEQVSVSGNLVCALDPAGLPRCWGDNGGGVHVPPPTEMVDLSVGDGGSCAIDRSGALHCFDSQGNTPAPSGSFEAVSCGFGGCCAIAAGSRNISCWGPDSLPNEPTGAFRAVDVGANHACAITVDDEVVCWGDDTYGQSTPP